MKGRCLLLLYMGCLLAVVCGVTFPMEKQSNKPPTVVVFPFSGKTPGGTGDLRLLDIILDAAIHAVDDYKIVTGTNPQIIESPSKAPQKEQLPLGSAYCLTGECFLGDDNETHAQLWLYDATGPKLIATDEMVFYNINEAPQFMGGLVNYLLGKIQRKAVNPETTADLPPGPAPNRMPRPNQLPAPLLDLNYGPPTKAYQPLPFSLR
jgi:hypothetical protein